MQEFGELAVVVRRRADIFGAQA